MSATRRRPLLATALVLAVCLGLSACGTAHNASKPLTTPSTTTPTTTVPTPSTTVPTAQITQCTTSQLKLSYRDEAGATGTLHVAYGLTNIGESTCSLYGYPGYQFLGAQGQPLPETPVRTEEPGSNFNGGQSFGPPRTVDLAPGATAEFVVAYGDLYPVPGDACYSASSIEVWPPNQTQALRISAPSVGRLYCGLPPRPIIDIGPVIVAREGTTPTSTTPAPPVTQCTTSQLRLSYQGLYGTAGTEHEWFAFTNVGVGTCSLYGYPGFQPLDAQGQPLPEDLVRTEQPGSNFNGGQSYGPPRTVDLGPGKTAHFQVAFGGTYPIPGQTCYSVSSIEVWPPNQTEALRIATNVNMSTKYCGPTPKPIIDIGPVITAKEGA